MANGSQHPYTFQKIHLQHYPSIRHFSGFQAWLPELHNLSGNGSYVNGGLCNPFLPPSLPVSVSQGSTSSRVPPLLPAYVGAPMEISVSVLDVIDSCYRSGVLAISYVATAPIERVRILVQNQGEMIRSSRLHAPYKGIGNCFARTIKKEGIRSLWRGNGTDVFSLLAGDTLVAYLNSRESHNKGKQGLRMLFEECFILAAAHLFLCPLKFAQTRLANNIMAETVVGNRQFSGFFDVFRKTLKSDGIAGLYRGYTLNFALEVMRSFVLEKMLLLFRPVMGDLYETGFWGRALAVAAAPVFSELVTYPMDTVCRRMMMRSGEAIKYRNTVDACSQIVRGEGWRSVYRGAGTGVVRLVIISAVMLAGDVLVKHFGDSGVPSPTITITFDDEED